MTVENFVRIVWTVFKKIDKSPKIAFFGHFRANFGYVSHIPVIRFRYHCTLRSTFRCIMTAIFLKLVTTVFEKFETFIEWSGDKKGTIA